MGAECWRNLLLLLAVLVLTAKLGNFQRWGGFQEKSTSKKNMNSTLRFFIENYNNVSNDTYLFRVDKVLQSYVQLTTGVEYLATVKISRTKCKKSSTKSHSCPRQSEKKMKKSFICDFLIYTVPWINYYELWNNSCLEAY